MAFDLTRFRALLRAERKARRISRQALADKVGRSKSTVQTAEMGPDIPGIDTVALLIEGMPGLTLGSFFDKLSQEDLAGGDIKTAIRPSLSAPGHDEAVPDAHEARLKALADQFAASLVAFVRSGLAVSDRRPPDPRPAGSRRRPGVRKRRRPSP